MLLTGSFKTHLLTVMFSAIEDAGASRIAVGNWAASIKLWIAPGLDSGATTTSKDEGESGNAITRAKAIGFLTATLEVLNKDLLRADQVELLVGFFGSMFSNDHKAGITPSTRALKQLATAKNFKPPMGVKIIEDVSKMKEDFRLQTAATRLEVYQLLQSLVEDPAVSGELQHKYGPSSGFILDLINMCQHERDPRNLMVWFKIVQTLAAHYSPSDEVTDEIFKTFSNYFPITLRESTTPIGVTPEELKTALRGCFSAHQRLARLAFPYLIQRLDQGDSIKVTVKNDILMTIKACIEKYENPHSALTPFITSIWNSLKYEVRNGEVAETVHGATSVLRAIAVRLQDDSPRLDEYIHMVFRDSLDDLSEPDYVKQAGQICLAAISSGPQAFVSHSPKLVDSVIQKIPQFKSAAHTTYTKDLLEVLEAILKTRRSLATDYPEDDQLLAAHSATPFQDLFHKVYLPLWRNNVADAEGPELGVLRAITSGVATLVTQEVISSDGQRSLLCSTDVCREICSLFTHRLLMPLTLSPRDAEAMVADVDIGLQESLSTVVTHYVDGFQILVDATTDVILDRDWRRPESSSVSQLWHVLCQVSFIGCSKVPTAIGLTSVKKKYSPLHHFMTWTGALLRLTETFLTNGADPRVVKLVVAGLHHSMFLLREACGSEALQAHLHAEGQEPLDWAREVKIVTAGVDIPPEWLRLLRESYPDIHGQVLGNTADDILAAETGAATPAVVSSSGDVFARFIRLSLFIVRHLIRRVTKEKADSEGGIVLRLSGDLVQYKEKRRRAIVEQVERLASMTISAMDAPSQLFYQLPTEAFRLFSNCNVGAPYWRTEEDGALNSLTLSILKGLWPEAMTGLYDADGVAQTLLCDETYTLSSNISQSQAWIVAILANKHKASLSTMDFTQVVKFWKNRLEQNMASYNAEDVAVGIDIERVLPILVGAVPRQERAVLPLISLVHNAIGLPNSVGEILAAEIEAVVDENAYLQTSMHAVVKPLYKQWTYAYLVKPMYELATSGPSDNQLSPEETRMSAEHYTIAILSVLKHCPFAVYESDIEPLVNMILTVLRNTDKVQHIQVALHILQQIMRNDAGALKYHLRSIINALTQVYRATLKTANNSPKEVTERQQLYRDDLGTDTAPVAKPPTPKSNPDMGPPVDDSPVSEKKETAPEKVPSESGKVKERSAKKSIACRKVVLELVGEMPGRFEDRYVMPFKGDMNHFLDACCGDPVRELRRVAVEAREGWFGLG